MGSGEWYATRRKDDAPLDRVWLVCEGECSIPLATPTIHRRAGALDTPSVWDGEREQSVQFECTYCGAHRQYGVAYRPVRGAGKSAA